MDNLAAELCLRGQVLPIDLLPDYESGTKPGQLCPADEDTGEGREGEMQVDASLVADGQSAEAGGPSQGALHDPAMAAEVLAALDAPSSDPWCDAAGPALAPAATVIAALVGVQLVRSASRATTPAGAHARHRVEGSRQHTAVVAVGPGQRQAEWRALGVHDEVALRARLAPLRRVRACRGEPPFRRQARTVEATRYQLSPSAS